jgi:hypothetical protein
MTAGKGLARNFDAWLPTKPASASASTPDPADAGDDGQPKSVREWSERHRRPEGHRFTLDRFIPLEDIYGDEHRHICVIKPAQRGISEWAINRTMYTLELGARRWHTGKNGLNVAYLFPTSAALTDFSKERLSGLRSETPHLAALLKGDGFAGVTFKQIGDSYLYLRGAWSESSLLSFAADVIVLDEYDRMHPRAVALARRRLGASPLKHEIDISTPTLPGKFIHALYLQSDQRVYAQPCPSCGAEVVYDFHRDVRVGGEGFDEWRSWSPTDIRKRGATLHCPECKGEVDDVARCVRGTWTAQEPEIRAIHGYKVPALAFPMAELEQFAVSAVSLDPTEATEFWRSDLGIPFDAAGARVTAAMLAQLAVDLPGGELPGGMKWRDTTMGVDVGARFHFRISSTGTDGIRYVRLMGSVATWDDLTRLMVRYQVLRGVIDALPELHACRDWAEKWHGRVLRAFYPNGTALPGLLFRPDEVKRIVQINRTMAMDGVQGAIAAGEERWPASIARDPEVVRHLGAPVRVVVEGDDGQARASWEHTEPDHLFHACVYDRVAHAVLTASRTGLHVPVFAQAGTSGWNPRRASK